VDVDDAIAVELGDTQVAQVLRVLLPSEEDPRARSLLDEVVDRVLDRPLHDVVGEHDDDRVTAREPLRETQRLRDPAGALLVRVGQPVDPPLVAVPEQAQELAGVGPPGHHHQLPHLRRDERLDRVGDHRAVVDRQQVLVRDPRQRMEARSAAAGEDDALHRPPMLRVVLPRTSDNG
jgi:hypothetical protein